MKLSGKTALITGGSSGIGKGLVKRFSQEGADVIFAYKSNEEGARALAEEITSAGGHAAAVRADLGKEQEVRRLFDFVQKEYGRLDILINNAGRTFNIALEELTEESLRRDLDVNLMGTVLCSKYAVPLMEKGGWIVNTASIRGMFDAGRPGIMGYCAAKAGVISFTKNLALRLAPKICVNAVCPGFVYTPYMDGNISQELKESWLRQIPMGSFVDMQELTDVYLLLSTSRALTGTAIPVDGGYTLLNR